MKGLIRFALHQSVLVNVVFVALVAMSLFWAAPNLAIDRYPNIAFGEVRVSTDFPGADPVEVERLVTDVLEESLRGMEDLEFVRSTSIANQSGLHIKFIDDTDYDALYEELRLRVLGVQGRLPTINGEPLTPSFQVVDVDEWLPVIQASIVSKDESRPLDASSLVLLGKDLRSRLELIDGVKKVLVLGDTGRQFVVSIDPIKLEKHGLSLQQVVGAMRRTGGAPPAGLISTSAGERLIKVDLRYRHAEDVLGAVIRRDGDGNVLRVADIAVPAETGVENFEGSVISTINGRDAVTCKVLKLREANSIDLKEEVLKVVDTFLVNHQDDGIEVVLTLDGTVVIKDGIGVLANSLLLSAVLVMVLLFLFLDRRHGPRMWIGLGLGLAAAIATIVSDVLAVKLIAIGILTIFVLASCRAAVLTVSGIVFSFLVTLLIFYVMGWSVSEISLVGLVLVSGIVVDDAIVVLENIQRHREEGASLIDSVVNGASEVFWPVTSATLTTLAAFLPMLMMTGAVGEFFSLVPIAVCSALAVSLVECLIIMPLHVVEAERLLGEDPNVVNHDNGKPHGITAWLDQRYQQLLSFNLRHPFLTVAGVGLCFLLAVAIMLQSQFAAILGQTPLIKNKFFPDDLSVIDVRIEMAAGTPQAETDQLVRALSKHLAGMGPENIASVTGLTGLSIDEAYRPVFGNQFAMLNLELPGKDVRVWSDNASFLRTLEDEVEKVSTDPANFVSVTPRQGGPPAGPPLQIRLTGLDDGEVLDMAETLLAFLRDESRDADGDRKRGMLYGLKDLTHDRTRTTTILQFEPDRDALALNNIADIEVQQFVADAIDGAFVGDFRRVDDEIPVKVRLARGGEAADPLALLDAPFANDPDGRLLRFADIGSLSVASVPATLIRRDFQRTVSITGAFADDSLVDASSVQPIVDRWLVENQTRWPGVAVAWGGEAESAAKSFASLQLAMVIAMFLIYGILSGQFKSYTQPMIIMSNIFFSFTGVVFALSLFGALAILLPGIVAVERSFFTVQVFIAIVGLTGLVVNDAIVLIDFINRRRREGLPLQLALMTAGRQRMRPILMTTATTIAGLLPMAIGIPDFSITWGPFATSFIVGLLFATSMTLLVVPVLYEIIDVTFSRLGRLVMRLLPNRAAMTKETIS